MQIENIKISELKHFEGNPRTISDADKKNLQASIKKFGFVDPAIIDENNVILGGNQRIDAARELGMVEVPCVRVQGLSDSEKKALNIALNKISGEWDEEKLTELLESLKTEDENLFNLTGFSSDEFNELIGNFEYPEKELDENIETKNKCPKCGYEY